MCTQSLLNQCDSTSASPSSSDPMADMKHKFHKYSTGYCRISTTVSAELIVKLTAHRSLQSDIPRQPQAWNGQPHPRRQGDSTSIGQGSTSPPAMLLWLAPNICEIPSHFVNVGVFPVRGAVKMSSMINPAKAALAQFSDIGSQVVANDATHFYPGTHFNLRSKINR